MCHIREGNREEEHLDYEGDYWKSIRRRTLNKDLRGTPFRSHGLILFRCVFTIVFTIAETACIEISRKDKS
jgi:hypothetical protein